MDLAKMRFRNANRLNRFRAFTHSLRFRLLLSHTALAILPLMLAGYVYYRFLIDEVQRKVSDSVLNTLSAAATIIDQKIGFVLSFINDFMSNEDVNKILCRNFREYSYQDVHTISTALAKTSDPLQLIRSTMLITETGHLYRSGIWEDIAPEKLMKDILSDPRRKGSSSSAIQWLGVRKTSALTSPSEYVLPVVGVLKRFTDFSDLGVLYVEISSKGLYDFSTLSGAGRKSYLIDQRGFVLASSDETSYLLNIVDMGFDTARFTGKSGYFSTKINGENQLVSYYSSALTGWRIIETSAIASLLPEVPYFKAFFISSVALLILIVGLFSLLLSSRIAKPIVSLSSLMERVEAGELDVKIEVSGKDEIRRLADSFNNMVLRLRESIAKIYDQEKAKKRLEFDALQAQINPHFLYNTLGNIQWMAIIYEIPSIANMCSSLSRLLRLSLSSPDPMVPVEQEIDMLVQYTYILNVRYNNRIAFVDEVSEEYRCVQIPRFLLQPLVENSILHGMDTEGQCRIVLGAAPEGGDLLLMVRDNGSGMNGAKLAEILSGDAANAEKTQRKRSIGLRNVHERIKLYFGEAYGLSMREQAEGGTAVVVRIPFAAQAEGKR